MKILVIKLHALGDLVIATPAFRRLREGLPEAEIHLLTTDWTAPAAAYNPCFKNQIIVPHQWFFSSNFQKRIHLINLLIKLRSYNFDAAVVFHINSAIVKFTKLTGIPNVFSFAGYNSKSTVYLDENRHSALTAWELADLAVNALDGIRQSPPERDNFFYDWFVQQEEEDSTDNILKSYNLKDKSYAALFPGGGVNPNAQDLVRRWDYVKFAEVGRLIKQKWDLVPVVMGGPTDLEVGAKVSTLIGAEAVNWCGKYNLRTTAALLKRSRLALSNDSAPLHIAAAVGVPVVGIFGPTGWRLKLPLVKKAQRAALDIPCSPCYFGSFKKCIFDHIKCMDELKVDYVFDQLQILKEQIYNSA